MRYKTGLFLGNIQPFYLTCRMYRKSYCTTPALALAAALELAAVLALAKCLTFFVKLYICDGQSAARRAIPYADRSCLHTIYFIDGRTETTERMCRFLHFRYIVSYEFLCWLLYTTLWILDNTN